MMAKFLAFAPLAVNRKVKNLTFRAQTRRDRKRRGAGMLPEPQAGCLRYEK